MYRSQACKVLSQILLGKDVINNTTQLMVVIPVLNQLILVQDQVYNHNPLFLKCKVLIWTKVNQ